MEGDTSAPKRKRTAENNGAEFETSAHRIESDEGKLREIKDQLDLTTSQVYRMNETMKVLVNEISTLQGVVLSLKNAVEEQDSIQSSPMHARPQELTCFQEDAIPTKFASTPGGPFPHYTPMDRTLPRPSAKEVAETLGGKEHSLQFTSNLYVDLIEKVLGPQEDNQQLDYKAMVKEAIMVTKAVVSYVKDAHRIDPDIRWSYIDPTVKLETYRVLESATHHLLPLKVCLEYWGAHVLISNFWVKRRKYNKKSFEKISISYPKTGDVPFQHSFLNKST